MASGIKGLPWKILSDEEVKRREDDAFGVHTAYAELLLKVAKECPTPFFGWSLQWLGDWKDINCSAASSLGGSGRRVLFDCGLSRRLEVFVRPSSNGGFYWRPRDNSKTKSSWSDTNMTSVPSRVI